jgi:hypothetical protein
VRLALEWSQPADLLVLAVHQDRPAILDFLDRVMATGWLAGEPVPA